MRQPRTLFAKTYLTLTVSMLLFLLLSALTVVYFILVPVSTRAANDLASLIVLSGKTWVELPPETRPDFTRELADKYELQIEPARETLAPPSKFLPYVHLLEAALYERTGQSISVLISQHGGEEWFNVDIEVADTVLRLSFPHTRIGARPPTALIYILALGTLIILVSSLYLARRITVPITRLSDATGNVGGGGETLALPESGPREVQELTRHFNAMNTKIDTLLAARSTLFAGISHDLRTPITRIQLALELLSENADATLVERIRLDLEELNQLISDTLDLSQGLAPHKLEAVDIYEFVAALVDSLYDVGGQLEFNSGGTCACAVDVLALRRVLTNLIENARRYGDGTSGVELICRHTDTKVFIAVLDRGVGIPRAECEAVFQPFYRVEQSRGRATGGSGLGLAIVAHLCDSNGWEIHLLPRDGGGTKAELILPINN